MSLPSSVVARFYLKRIWSAHLKDSAHYHNPISACAVLWLLRSSIRCIHDLNHLLVNPEEHVIPSAIGELQLVVDCIMIALKSISSNCKASWYSFEPQSPKGVVKVCQETWSIITKLSVPISLNKNRQWWTALLATGFGRYQMLCGCTFVLLWLGCHGLFIPYSSSWQQPSAR